MKKILEMALKSLELNAETVSKLVEIIEVSPNPLVSTEYLLGIYEKPEIPLTVKKGLSFDSRDKNFEFLNFDILKQEVEYQYDDFRVVYYLNKDVNKERPYYSKPSDNEEHYSSEDTYKKTVERCSLKKWLDSAK